MQYFRKIHKHYLVVYLIASAMLLRTFIAPGFMLDMSKQNSEFLTITLCHGPTGSNELNNPVSSDQEEQKNCHLWTSSSTSLFIDKTNINYKNGLIKNNLPLYKNLLNNSYITTSKYARAPPTLI